MFPLFEHTRDCDTTPRPRIMNGRALEWFLLEKQCQTKRVKKTMPGRKSRLSSCSCANLRFSSWSCGSILRVLDLYYKVAISELELRRCTSRTRLVFPSCDFKSWSYAGVLRVRDLCYKVVIFELELWKCTARTKLVLQSWDVQAGAAELYFTC